MKAMGFLASCWSLGGVRVLSRVPPRWCLPLGGVKVLRVPFMVLLRLWLPLGGVRVLSRYIITIPPCVCR